MLRAPQDKSFGHYAVPAMALFCLFPFVDPALALAFGIICAILIGNPYKEITEKLPKKLLAWCVIGLGGAMNLNQVLEAGASGFAYTAISITLTLAVGFALIKLFKLERESGVLITVGTAICGGSAIAAIAPVLQAKSGPIAISLAVVFVLNAAALMMFPYIGHALELSQHQFGLWSALAIHDTSSVVGAGLKYGEEALQTGTSVKLARALWIVPLVVAMQAFYSAQDKKNGHEDQARPKRKYPWFIGGFLVLAALVTYMPVLAGAGEWIAYAARRGLVLTLFLIGCNIHADVIRGVGVRPFLFGILLWLIVSVLSLGAILSGLVS